MSAFQGEPHRRRLILFGEPSRSYRETVGESLDPMDHPPQPPTLTGPTHPYSTVWLT